MKKIKISISAKKIVRLENIFGQFSDFLRNSSKTKGKIVVETRNIENLVRQFSPAAGKKHFFINNLRSESIKFGQNRARRARIFFGTKKSISEKIGKKTLTRLFCGNLQVSRGTLLERKLQSSRLSRNFRSKKRFEKECPSPPVETLRCSGSLLSIASWTAEHFAQPPIVSLSSNRKVVPPPPVLTEGYKGSSS